MSKSGTLRRLIFFSFTRNTKYVCIGKRTVCNCRDGLDPAAELDVVAGEDSEDISPIVMDS